MLLLVRKCDHRGYFSAATSNPLALGVNFLGFVAFLIFVVIPASALVDAERQLHLRQIVQCVLQVEGSGEEIFIT